MSFLLLGNSVFAFAQSPARHRSVSLNTSVLSRRISALAAGAKPGLLGVAVQEMDGGAVWTYNGAHRFPMQSVFKAPLAAALLARVDRGTLSLGKKLVLTRVDLHGGVIEDQFKGDSETFTVRELIKSAIIDSDNSAADALLPLVGGPQGVTQYLRAHGITGMRVDRNELMLARTMGGVPSSVPLTVRYSDAIKAVPLTVHRRVFAAYFSDPRDTALPAAAVQFLVQLKRGKMLSPASTAMLLQDMEDVRTGLHRLKAGLPVGSRLAHKTGTSGIFEGVSAATNDIGLIGLPDGRTLAVAVFLEKSSASEAKREAVIADVARAVVSAVR